MLEGQSNVIPMARVEILHDASYGDLLTGPSPAIRGTFFEPLQEVRLEIACQDRNGYPWKSVTNYQVDSAGIFDTSVSVETGNAYNGDAADRPFTSMQCQYGSGHDFSGKDIGRVEYHVSCYDQCDTKIWSSSFNRYLGRDLRCVPDPWSNVLLFDDEINSEGIDTMLALAPYGVAVVGHMFAASPRNLPSPVVDFSIPTYVIGSGRASATALQYAIGKPEIQGVILFSGTGIRFDPLEDLEYIALDVSGLDTSGHSGQSTRSIYDQASLLQNNEKRARVKVERIQCPIFMFSGADDQVWPSASYCEEIVRWRQDKACVYPTVLRTFQNVGHDIGPSLGFPGLPTTERSIGVDSSNFRFLMGGEFELQARARRACWKDLLGILGGKGSEFQSLF